MRQFSLYIHIPFCFHKCPYCDFNTYAVSSIPEIDYTAALLSELDYRATHPEWNGRAVQTIFFGGGTPSLFSAEAITRIITTIARIFPVEDRAEITLEANPGTVTTESLKGYRDSGVNRISFGAQSFNGTILKNLGRIHSPEQTAAAVQAAQLVGINNINLDLIYGSPSQTLSDFESDLHAALELKPYHISAYGLTIEKGTEFFTRFKKGQLKLPKEQAVISMFELVNRILPENGFYRYEISNFSLPGKEARHNMAYWNGDDYLGLGAGAHSFCRGVDGMRWANYALPQKYIEAASTSGKAEAWSEKLTKRDSMFEFFFLGLRKSSGVKLTEFKARFGTTIDDAYPALIEVLLEQDLLRKDNDSLLLSERGLLLADSVIENFASN